MAFEHKENSGSLFENDRKTNDRQPDMTGTVNVDGKVLRIAAWKKEGNRGTFYSLKFSEPYVEEKKDDSVPF